MFYPFYKKMPFFNRSIGFLLVIVILLAITVPILFASIWFGGGDRVSTGMPTYYLIATFIFAARNSLPYFFLGISYENQIILHKFFSYMAVISGFLHGGDYLLYEDGQETRKINGGVLWISMFLLVLTGILFKWM